MLNSSFVKIFKIFFLINKQINKGPNKLSFFPSNSAIDFQKRRLNEHQLIKGDFNSLQSQSVISGNQKILGKELQKTGSASYFRTRL